MIYPRWVVGLVGGEFDELEERLVFGFGSLPHPWNQHGIVAEVLSGDEILERLGVGDQLHTLTILKNP